MKCKLSIQEKLKDLRIEKGLSLQELAEQTGISRASLGNYETDDYKEITHKAIVALLKFVSRARDALLARKKKLSLLSLVATRIVYQL